MKIEITLDSSLENSSNRLIISNLQEGNHEVLLQIESESGTENIFVLLSSLKKALSKIG